MGMGVVQWFMTLGIKVADKVSEGVRKSLVVGFWESGLGPGTSS